MTSRVSQEEFGQRHKSALLQLVPHDHSRVWFVTFLCLWVAKQQLCLLVQNWSRNKIYRTNKQTNIQKIDRILSGLTEPMKQPFKLKRKAEKYSVHGGAERLPNGVPSTPDDRHGNTRHEDWMRIEGTVLPPGYHGRDDGGAGQGHSGTGGTWTTRCSPVVAERKGRTELPFWEGLSLRSSWWLSWNRTVFTLFGWTSDCQQTFFFAKKERL